MKYVAQLSMTNLVKLMLTTDERIYAEGIFQYYYSTLQLFMNVL